MAGDLVRAAADPLDAPCVGLVAERVGEDLGRELVGDRVPDAVQEAVELAQGERSPGTAQEGKAHRPELPATQLLGAGLDGRQRLLVDDGSPAAASAARIAGTELFVDGSDLGEELLAFDRELDELLVELSDAGAGAVLPPEETPLAPIGNAARAEADRDEVAAAHLGQAGLRELGVDHGGLLRARSADSMPCGSSSAREVSLQEPVLSWGEPDPRRPSEHRIRL
jgi:hypothetical protein